jgi:hypothetical protein
MPPCSSEPPQPQMKLAEHEVMDTLCSNMQHNAAAGSERKEWSRVHYWPELEKGQELGFTPDKQPSYFVGTDASPY